MNQNNNDQKTRNLNPQQDLKFKDQYELRVIIPKWEFELR